MAVRYPGIGVANLISSIASANLQKITFVQDPWVWGYHSCNVNWGILDDPLCLLVDRVRCKRELGVDFLLADAYEPTGELGVVNSLAKFTEKGRMRVVWVGRDGSKNVVYSSGG